VTGALDVWLKNAGKEAGTKEKEEKVAEKLR